MAWLRGLLCLVIISFIAGYPVPLEAAVLYEKDRFYIDGVSFLRDKEDPTAYYYLPTVPRVAPRPDGSGPDMFFVKFIDPKGSVSGGLVHFLFTLDLPGDQVEELEKKLRKKSPKAVIRGPVPLLASRDEESAANQLSSFRIISSTLSSSGKDGFTSTLVASGAAPLTPGSRAAVAARLNEHGATLLWESLTKPTTDISVSVSAYYEAAIEGYRGKVSADLETVYGHMFKVLSRQAGHSKRELREQVDELVRTGVVEVDVTDRSGLDINTGQMAGIMNLVTDKLISMLFDTTTGLSKLPEKEKVREPVPGRRHRSTLSKFFGGSSNPKYISDDQYTLRKRKDVTRGHFSLVFTHNTTIKVPFESAGNIRGLYQKWSEDTNIFRTVNLADTAFERREVYFEVDPSFYDAFRTTINSVSISFVKKYRPAKDQDDFTGEAIFTQNDVKSGKFSKSIRYPRLGMEGGEWLDYEYRLLWSFRGGKVLGVPLKAGDYLKESAPYVTLAPPVNQTTLELEGNEAALLDAYVHRAEVAVQYKLLGRTKIIRLPLRVGKGELLETASFLSDSGTKPSYRIRWYYDDGKQTTEAWQPLTDNYIFVVPPKGE